MSDRRKLKLGTDSQVDVDAVGDATTLRRTENPTLTNATSVKRQTGRSDLLATLPTELLHLVVSQFDADVASFVNVSLVSKRLRAFVLSPQCERDWIRAIERAGIPTDLEGGLKPVELGSLAFGRTCRVCGKHTARKVDFYLRCRLCSTCWQEQIVYEGPDEPDPAFEGFFVGTKRYTPRSRSGKRWKKMKTFFLLSSLEATSEFLSDLLGPQVDAYEAALELDPLAELDDFMMFENLPASTRATLDERQEWVKRVSRDGDKLTAWYETKTKAERDAKKRSKRGFSGDNRYSG